MQCSLAFTEQSFLYSIKNSCQTTIVSPFLRLASCHRSPSPKHLLCCPPRPSIRPTVDIDSIEFWLWSFLHKMTGQLNSQRSRHTESHTAGSESLSLQLAVPLFPSEMVIPSIAKYFPSLSFLESPTHNDKRQIRRDFHCRKMAWSFFCQKIYGGFVFWHLYR
jgi:hypothetical protein